MFENVSYVSKMSLTDKIICGDSFPQAAKVA